MEIEELEAHASLFCEEVQKLRTKRGNGNFAVPRTLSVDELDRLLSALTCAEVITDQFRAHLSGKHLANVLPECANPAHLKRPRM